ncbi:MAG: sigma-70 family RNA polymerase sigma factor [Bacteroidota bacterium]|nr:sigma-70 family RNA polymerase sigma factor [Bacteroidota bacterium]
MEAGSGLTDKALRDYNLVRKAVDKGDEKAYAELMSYYKDSIYYMLLKMTGNSDDASDLTIEAFGKAFKKLSQYTPDFAFSTWLFKIASNNCIDFIRRKRKNVVSLDKQWDGNENADQILEIPSQNLDPEESYIRKQKIKLMRDIVEKLKPHYRTLVELRYFSEHSYEEIAEELKLPLGTVKAQLFRARELMYNMLKNSEHII